MGVIALNERCLGTKAYITQGEGIEYWGVPKTQVTLYRKPKSKMLVGRCQLQPAS